MLEELSGYLVQAPIAVIMFIYIWLADKRNSKTLDGYKETTDKMIKLVEDLTNKIAK